MKNIQLRIGNYLHDNKDRLCKVEEIYKDGFRAPSIIGGITSLPNKSITLSSDILLNFGGEKDSDGICFLYLKKEFDVRIYLHPEQNHIIVTKGQYYNIDTLEHINTVHQLQNYFYIKTNRELTPLNHKR